MAGEKCLLWAIQTIPRRYCGLGSRTPQEGIFWSPVYIKVVCSLLLSINCAVGLNLIKPTNMLYLKNTSLLKTASRRLSLQREVVFLRAEGLTSVLRETQSLQSARKRGEPVACGLEASPQASPHSRRGLHKVGNKRGHTHTYVCVY
jgi:hypothetical protein